MIFPSSEAEGVSGMSPERQGETDDQLRQVTKQA